MRTVLLALAALSLVACTKKDPPPVAPATPSPSATASAPPSPSTGTATTASGARRPAVAADDRLYARVEGTAFANACAGDGDCKRSGCSSEVCSAVADVTTTCEMPADGFPPGAAGACGCVSGQCIWYLGGDGAPAGAPCGSDTCDPGQTCVTYFGFAGPNGPKLHSCEITCADQACPAGLKCVTIADGPGKVCRPPAE